MKKITLSLLFMAVLILVSGGLSSCNKKLKKEIDELDSSVSDLKSKNAALENDLAATKGLLGTNEPMAFTFISNNSTSEYLNISDAYYFKAGKYETQYLEDNQDGTYEIYIERLADVNWDASAWIQFDYNANTNTVSDARFGAQGYSTTNSGYYSSNFRDTDAEATVTVTLNSFNATTGEINVSVTGTSTANYIRHNTSMYNPSYYNSYSAANGGIASGSANFAGTLEVYKKSNSGPVNL